jgi:tRNA A58 N-methylase Trm61
MKPKLPDNVRYRHFNLTSTGNYSKSILKFNKEFDVIVIDGRKRVNCARSCLSALNETGVIIWDNSDREQYLEGYNFLSDNGFKRLDFAGLGPINHFGSCTSIFYRTENCFDI